MQVKRAKVSGELYTNCGIDGTPVVKAYMAMSQEPDDISLHRSTIDCLKSLKAEKVMEFVPPNGTTAVLGYTYNNTKLGISCLL
jgi:hypothetical protein